MNSLGNNFLLNEAGSAVKIETYKLVTVGDLCVGKTSILSRYKYEAIEDIYSPTVGIDFLSKNVFLEDKTIRLIMWDTAGQERFKSLIPSYLKNADCVLLVFDITNRNSFDSLSKWLKDIKDNVQEGVEVIICGNKIDLTDKRIVKKEEVDKFCQEESLIYIETSALTGEGIDNLFNTILEGLSEGSINLDKNNFFDSNNKEINEKNKEDNKPQLNDSSKNSFRYNNIKINEQKNFQISNSKNFSESQNASCEINNESKINNSMGGGVIGLDASSNSNLNKSRKKKKCC